MPELGGKEEKRGKWLKIELASPPELVDALSNFLTEIGAQGVYQEVLQPQIPEEISVSGMKEVIQAYLPFDMRLESRLASLNLYLESLSELFPELEKIQCVKEVVFDQDWGEEWKKYFKPLRVSRNIVIKPTWERYAPAGRDIIIDIDPGMAFGTGQHPSTRMCLEAIEDILLKERTKETWKVLDVGTGTGILGISCAKLGVEKVICVDIDKKAVDIARENVKINHVEDRVEVINRDVNTVHDSFHLIVANLTAKILIRHCSHLQSLIRNGGYLVISGFIDQNRDDIESHFLIDPFICSRVITEKEWVCYVLRKGGNGR